MNLPFCRAGHLHKVHVNKKVFKTVNLSRGDCPCPNIKFSVAKSVVSAVVIHSARITWKPLFGLHTYCYVIRPLVIHVQLSYVMHSFISTRLLSVSIFIVFKLHMSRVRPI